MNIHKFIYLQLVIRCFLVQMYTLFHEICQLLEFFSFFHCVTVSLEVQVLFHDRLINLKRIPPMCRIKGNVFVWGVMVLSEISSMLKIWVRLNNPFIRKCCIWDNMVVICLGSVRKFMAFSLCVKICTY